jgi:hypothetical protein
LKDLRKRKLGIKDKVTALSLPQVKPHVSQEASDFELTRESKVTV